MGYIRAGELVRRYRQEKCVVGEVGEDEEEANGEEDGEEEEEQ